MARVGDRRGFNQWPDFTEEQRREFGRRGAANQKPADKGFASVPGLAAEAGRKGARAQLLRRQAMVRVIGRFALERLVEAEIAAMLAAETLGD